MHQKNVEKKLFHTSLWCLKRFNEGLKPFEAPERSAKIKI